MTATAAVGWLLASAIGASAPSGWAPEAAPAVDHDERHCVVEVVDERDGVLVTGPERCHDTFAEASADAAGSVVGVPTEAEQPSDAAVANNNTIGVHFTEVSFSGSSITIVGTTCSGGVWRPSGSWDDNIASSYHHCGSRPTQFYDASSCAGTPHNIYGAAASLHGMNDRTSCVRYG